MVVNFICPLRVSLFKKRNRQHESLIAFQKINFDIIKNCSCWCHRPGGGFQYRLAIVAIKKSGQANQRSVSRSGKAGALSSISRLTRYLRPVNQSISSRKLKLLGRWRRGQLHTLARRSECHMSSADPQKQFQNFYQSLIVAGNQTITGIFPGGIQN